MINLAALKSFLGIFWDEATSNTFNHAVPPITGRTFLGFSSTHAITFHL